ncbi:hypothetical protein E7681_03525 [Thalassobius vesicularis]|uniref:Uncharacterized protein n=1 Tax=Thalassobius vesicularis TaxID=1294297 RepID=A0A4S3MGP7_9RHOB|nr:hypothetical protein [Thalassobius vesicularis]THD76924.1 hypothetical protein E7681_03525 [Thalassobius vesicularis]
MQITFTPMRQDVALSLHKSGETLIINGEAFDFSALPEGATLPQAAVACAWLGSDVERQDGQVHLTLILPHGVHAAPETLFPAPVTLVEDGPVTLPPYEAPAEEITV